MSQYYSYESELSQQNYRTFYLKTYGKMALGLLLTAAVAFFCYIDLITNWEHSFVFGIVTGFSPMIIAIVQIGLAMLMGTMLQRLSPMAVHLCFIIYCALTGVTLSTLPLAFGVGTVFTAVLFTAVLFINLLIIGMTTKVDITRFRGILIAGLWTLIFMSLFSLFIRGSFFATIYDYIGVFIFMGLTAYDAQALKRFYVMGSSDRRYISNFATMAAFELYLDFINLFLRILSIFARSQNDN